MEEQFLNQDFSKPKEKKGKTIIIIVLSILLAISITISVVILIQGRTSYNDLNEEYQLLSDKYDELSSADTSLRSDYNSLETKYNSLQTEHNNLKTEYDSLENEYNSLQAEYNTYLEENSVVYETPSDLSEYDNDITYDNLARTPDDYEGKAVKFKGTVLQVIDGTDEVDIRLAVNDDYDDVLFCGYDPSITSQRVLENDTITIYGISANLYSYESTLGGVITIPAVWVQYIEFE